MSKIVFFSSPHPKIVFFLSPHGYLEPATPEVAFPLYTMDYPSQLQWVEDLVSGDGNDVAHIHDDLPLLRALKHVRQRTLSPQDLNLYVWDGPTRGWEIIGVDEDGDLMDELPMFWKEHDPRELSFKELFS